MGLRKRLARGNPISRAVEVARSVVGGARTNFAWDGGSRRTIITHLEQWSADRPDDRFLWFEGEWWTIGRFNRATNRAAHGWARLGVHRGDTVALMIANRPEYVIHFYALLKLGAVAALINPALRTNALEHALNTAAARATLLDSSTEDALETARAHGGETRTLDVGENSAALFDDRGEHETNPRAAEHHRLGEVAAYIYTSGTTGLPKAAVVKHHRIVRAGMVMGGVLRFTSADAIYCCLPLYHGNATMISIPIALTHRGRVAIARKFSASRFWDDCRASGATAATYVGEVCRYLVNREPGPDERAHSVVRMVGNGLQADLWPAMEARFGIEHIHEFYASTEGNAETINLFGRTGSCGPLLPWKMAVVRYDHERGDVVRNPKGRCERARPNEPGLLLGKITASNEYTGYADRRASASKIRTDVFSVGDAWFDTGDLVAFDRTLHLRFIDRLGDTFRWKSENVSTREVGEALAALPGLLESSVYGVSVPGHEGRAGMAAIVLDGAFDGAAVYRAIHTSLPGYAAPRFLRQVDTLEVTGTFKHRKQELQREGFAEHGDPVWVRDPDAQRYVGLNHAIRGRIADGSWKL